MIWRYHGRTIPLEVYHGVPDGWRARDIVQRHLRARGTFSLAGPEATEPGAPSWLPQRQEWLQYRETLRRVAHGVQAADPSCVELAVGFIVLRYIGSYSGYLRARLARSLKAAPLTERQKAVLHAHFLDLVKRGERTDEFREYARLWRRFITPAQLEAAVRDLQALPDGGAKARWLAGKLQP